MPSQKLYMLLLGCKPKGRHTEQHDLFFTVANSLKATIPDIHSFWPDGGKIHIDAWREVNVVNNFKIKILKKSSANKLKNDLRLFFINLGGYKKGEFEEFHYKMVVAAANKTEAINQAKSTAFFMHTGFKGASSHIDDKYGIDVDDLYEISEILPEHIKTKYRIVLTPAKGLKEDKMNLGYTNLAKIK